MTGEVPACASKHTYTVTGRDGETLARTEIGPKVAWVLWASKRPESRDVTAAHLDGVLCPVGTRNVRALLDGTS